ncbi:MAG: hypothetical protein ABSB58_09135 [Gemmatimonadales bacterium]
MARALLAALCAACVTAAAAAPAAAQALPRPIGVAADPAPAVALRAAWRDSFPPGPRPAALVAGLTPPASRMPLARRPWVWPIASLLVPGSGQLLAGRPRGVVYLAAEVWLLARAVALRHDSRTESAFFRSLAYTVARRRYGYERVDGPWPYYEEMGKYIESGVLDSNPTGAFSPETDTTTYNGHLWQLARRTFFENPDSTPDPSSPSYTAALRFYQARGVSDVYRWSWRNARLEQDVYRASIRASDDAYRAATNYLGGVLLNHLLSAVDAFIAARIGRSGVLPAVRPAAAGPGALLEWRAAF